MDEIEAISNATRKETHEAASAPAAAAWLTNPTDNTSAGKPSQAQLWADEPEFGEAQVRGEQTAEQALNAPKLAPKSQLAEEQPL